MVRRIEFQIVLVRRVLSNLFRTNVGDGGDGLLYSRLDLVGNSCLESPSLILQSQRARKASMLA